MPGSSFGYAVQENHNTTAYNHAQDAHDTASHNPSMIPDGALQKVRPGNLRYERRCDVTKRDEALGSRSGNEIERGRQDDDIEDWQRRSELISNDVQGMIYPMLTVVSQSKEKGDTQLPGH